MSTTETEKPPLPATPTVEEMKPKQTKARTPQPYRLVLKQGKRELELDGDVRHDQFLPGQIYEELCDQPSVYREFMRVPQFVIGEAPDGMYRVIDDFDPDKKVIAILPTESDAETYAKQRNRAASKA